MSILQTITDLVGSATFTLVNEVCEVDVRGFANIQITVAGTYSGVLFIEASNNNGTSWNGIYALAEPNGGLANNFGGFGIFPTGTVNIPCGGFTNVRLRAGTFTSGTANINWSVSKQPRAYWIYNGNPGNLQAAIAGIVDDVATAVAAEGFPVLARMTPYRALHMNLRDQGGNEIVPEYLKEYQTASVSITSIGDSTIVAAPGAGLSILVKRITLSTTSAASINPFLREGVGGVVKKRWLTTTTFNFTEESNWKLPANTALVINLAVAVATGVAVNVEYLIV